jgi:hypothetical protein
LGVTGPGSEARFDVAAGTLMRAAAEWYQPVGLAGLFVAPSAGVERRQGDGYAGRQWLTDYTQTAYDAGVDLGIEVANLFEWRAGYFVEHLDGRVVAGNAVVPLGDGAQRYFAMQATFDGQTGPTIPERGLYARARIRRFTHTAVAMPTLATPFAGVEPNDLMSGEADASVFVPVSRAGRVFIATAGGSSFRSTAVVNAFTLGGPFTLGALNSGELRGSNYLLATAGYFHQVHRFAQGAAGVVYAGGWLESGSTFERISGAGIKTNVSAGFVVETPLGPISAAASVGVDGRYRFYAGLGPLWPRSR